MNIISLIAVYFVVWWLCLFAVLPFGVRSQQEAGEVIEGTEAGAPAVPMIAWKMLATTILAAVIMAVLYWLMANPTLQEYWR